MRESWAVAAALAACLVAPAGASAAATAFVTFPTDGTVRQYDPSTVRIGFDDEVVWRGSFARHPLDLDDGGDPIDTGTEHAEVYPLPGTYEFFCAVHPSVMRGEVVVTGPAPTDFPFPDDEGPALFGDDEEEPGIGVLGSDAAAPRARYTGPASLLGRRPRIRFVSMEAGSATATVIVGRRRVLGRASTTFAAPGRQRLTLALKRTRRTKAMLVLVVRDADGNARTIRREIRLRR